MMPSPQFAQVLIPAPLKEPLIYSVPEELQFNLLPGTRVLIPLLRRTVTGVVLGLSSESPGVAAKQIFDVLDDRPILDLQLIKLAQWMSRYYLASIGEVLATMLPANSRRESRQVIYLKNPAIPFEDDLCQRILAAIQRGDGRISFGTLMRRFPGQPVRRAVARLETAAAIELREHLAKQRKTRTAASADAPAQAAAPLEITLNDEQQIAVAAVAERVRSGGFEVFLLHGVTGAGKTEVYLRAMEAARERCVKSLILIPEISLTPELLDRLRARVPQRGGILHSGLTPAQRWAEWKKIAWGEIDVVIGARSAVFAPVPDLGLIVVDEEHDSSYKQEEGVRYHGRDVAVLRAKQQGCPIILGSATPSLESYENCRQGRYRLLEIHRRVADRPLPKIETIDLRRRLFGDGPSPKPKNAAAVRDASGLISPELAKALQDNFLAGRQSLIFLNRRVFANFL